MDGFFNLLIALFTKVDNVAVLVLIAVLAGSLYLHVIWRKEEREDRRVLLELLSKNTDALNSVRLAISVMAGRVV